MSDVWFTADTHYGHSRVIEYSKRPVAHVDEMNERMVQLWNAVVRPGDRVYHLGDFALCDPERATKFAARLMGQKFLTWGNHDKALRKHAPFLGHWQWQRELTEIKVDEQRIVLCHYAMKTWNQSHRGAWQLHGHSHGSLRDDPHSLQLDVGVDCWDLAPVNLDVIRARMAQKDYRPIDHHENRED